jgi:hypothetical protein
MSPVPVVIAPLKGETTVIDDATAIGTTTSGARGRIGAPGTLVAATTEQSQAQGTAGGETMAVAKATTTARARVRARARAAERTTLTTGNAQGEPRPRAAPRALTRPGIPAHRCGRCGNVNWARRDACNKCNERKPASAYKTRTEPRERPVELHHDATAAPPPFAHCPCLRTATRGEKRMDQAMGMDTGRKFVGGGSAGSGGGSPFPPQCPIFKSSIVTGPKWCPPSMLTDERGIPQAPTPLCHALS